MERISDAECRELGLLPLEATEEELRIGAMNPDLKAAKKIAKKIEAEEGKRVRLVQITSEEWEKWYQDKSITERRLSGGYADNLSNREDHEPKARKEEGETQGESTTPPRNPQEEELIDTLKDQSIEDEKGKGLKELEGLEDLKETERSDDLHSRDETIRAVAEILTKSDELGASDIHIEPQEENLRIRYRVDGVLEEHFSFDKKQSGGIIARTKILSRLDVAEKRVPQDGRIRVELGKTQLDFRVSTLPGKFGEKIVLRALRSDSSILNLEKLIGEKRELDLLRMLCDSPYGIFIVVGPTGSGKSTTLYAILSEHNDPGINISTVEDPIEYTLPGLHQVQVIREKGLDFSKALRALMRQDPDVILVGETRDKETAQVAMEAALTGHMVFTTLHANDTATAVSRLLEMGVAPYLISSSVVGVLSQRLMRRVCNSCSSLVQSDSENELLKKFDIKEHRVPNVKVGGGHTTEDNVCIHCKGMGYKGRVGVYEVLRIDDEIRHLVLMEKSADEIREVSRNRGMRTLLEYGMEMVRQGMSTIEEVERVCVLERDNEDEQTIETQAIVGETR